VSPVLNAALSVAKSCWLMLPELLKAAIQVWLCTPTLLSEVESVTGVGIPPTVAGTCFTVAHEASVPSVVKYFPELVV